MKSSNFGTIRKIETGDIDGELGPSVGGTIEMPWAGWPRLGESQSIVVNGFFSNIESDERKTCRATGAERCGWSAIIDTPTGFGKVGFSGSTVVANTDRDVNNWGASVEQGFYLPGILILRSGQTIASLIKT